MFIYPYKTGSASAKALSLAVGAKRIKHERSKFKGDADKLVINWGNSGNLPEEVAKCTILNPPDKVRAASNKLEFFRKIRDYNDEDVPFYIYTPEFTDSRDRAQRWSNNGHCIVARQVLNGHSGEGIVLVEPEGDVPDAPLYVKYIPKKQEYRVHVAGGVVVDLQRKARDRDVPDDKINWKIRNHCNGFIFARNDLVVPYGVAEQATTVCHLLGLDFGAVDIIYNEKQQQAYVLEVNTAPGLTGQTLDGYAERFKNWGKEPAEFIGIPPPPKPFDLNVPRGPEGRVAIDWDKVKRRVDMQEAAPAPDILWPVEAAGVEVVDLEYEDDEPWDED